MSEYQYYEFQAIDRPLTENEMGQLRSCSTRARITPTSFVNEYSWGNFKGDEDAWMEKYFDAFLYLANWGTRVFKLRLPARLLDASTARAYCLGQSVFMHEKNGKIILTFMSEEEAGDDWVEGDGQLSSLISVRSELARGDLRALYLGWLLCAQSGDLQDNEIEPPVPAGLAQLSASLEGLVEFLRIDTDLLDAAATASPPLVSLEPQPAEVREWVAKLPAAEKDDLLTRCMTSNDGSLATELVQRMRRAREGDRGAGQAADRRGSPSRRRAGRRRAKAHRRREGCAGEGPDGACCRTRQNETPRSASGQGARPLAKGGKPHRNQATEELRPGDGVARGPSGSCRAEGCGRLPAAGRGAARRARAQADAHGAVAQVGAVNPPLASGRFQRRAKVRTDLLSMRIPCARRSYRAGGKHVESLRVARFTTAS